MSRKYISFFLILTLLLSLLSGCGSNNGELPSIEVPVDPNNGGDLDPDVEPPTDEEVIAAWIEDSSNIFLAQSRELEGKQYILVTYGMKESGGYGVEITEVDIQDDRVEVTVKFLRPKAGQEVTDAIEYPHALEEIAATGLPTEFVTTGAEEYVPHLVGLDYLLPVVASSQGIYIFSPERDAVVDRQFVVTGIGNVFEGNIQYKLLDQDETVLVSGFGIAAMGDWQYFTIPIVVDDSVIVEESLILKLFTISAKDSEIQDLVEIPLTLDK
jgi:hypothetical protein